MSCSKIQSGFRQARLSKIQGLFKDKFKFLRPYLIIILTLVLENFSFKKPFTIFFNVNIFFYTHNNRLYIFYLLLP